MSGCPLNCNQPFSAEAVAEETELTEARWEPAQQKLTLPERIRAELSWLLVPLTSTPGYRFFCNVTMSSSFSCFYCSPKILGCSAGITKTEIQSVFSPELWGSGAMGVFVIFSCHWRRAKASGDTESIQTRPIGCQN